jgi:hypothetical protein
MTEQVQWPSLPASPYPEHQKEYAKTMFDAQVAGAKARQQLIDDIDKAKQ